MRLPITGIAALFSAVLFLLFSQPSSGQPLRSVAQNQSQGNPAAGDADINVAGVPVRSGTTEQVRAYLQQKLAPKLDRRIVLTDGSRTAVRTRRELGVQLDLGRMMAGVRAGQKYVPLVLTADLGATKDALGRIANGFYQPPIDAAPYVYKGQVQISPGTYERRLNVPTTAARLTKQVSANAATRYVSVALNKKPPTLTADRLQGITGVLGTYATRAANNAGRDRNIEIAVEAINGTLLSPGETFSLNETVGRRTRARGFKEATVFVDAELVPGVGGGVSQVTGTLFNAAALAGLRIDQVNPHSRPVSYIPLGRDATVAWGSKNLRFTNKTDAPVYIKYTFERQRLRATLFGKNTDGQKIRLVPRIQRRAPGKIDAQLYRVVRQDGKVIAKERLFDHGYRWDPDAN